MKIGNDLSTFLILAERTFLFIANGLLAVMVAINFVNILTRLLFDIGLIWVFPVTTVMFVWVVFFSFYVIYRRGQDISVDVATRQLPEPWARFTRIISNLVALALMVTICWQAFILLPRQVGHIDLVGIQRYWLSVPLYMSSFLVSLDMLLRTAGELGITTFDKGKPE